MDPATCSGAVGRQNGHATADESLGFDQSVFQFCLALKTKLAKALDHPQNVLPIASIKALEEELLISVALCRRAINHHHSSARSLPPEVLAAVASHLDDDKSLIATTHVCHRWRSTLLSFPRLWSHVEFSDERRAMAFLERSKSTPVFVYLPGINEPSEAVKESLKSAAGRLIGLKGSYSEFLGELLTQPLPLLRDLDLFRSSNPPRRNQPVSALPSVRSLTTCSLRDPPRVSGKNLTNFRFELLESPSRVLLAFGGTLLKFLRGCPLLEVLHFGYGFEDGDIGSSIGPSTEIVSLPCLRSFTHDSPFDKVDIPIFNRLSLPPTCNLAFAIVVGVRTPWDRPWTRGFPTLRKPRTSDIKTVKVMVDFQDTHTPHPTFRTELFNSRGVRISFALAFTTRVSDPRTSSAFIKLLNFLESSGITHSVEVLRLENLREGLPKDLTGCLNKFDNLKTLTLWQCELAPFLPNLPPPAVWCHTVQKLVVCPLPPKRPGECWDEISDLRKVWNIAIERQKRGIPLGTVTIFSRDIQYLLRGFREEIEVVRSLVGSMEVVGLGD